MNTRVILAFGMPAAPEWIVIGILALILLGPRKLPDLARGIGKALGEIQKAREDFQREIHGAPPLPKIEPPEGRQSTGASPGLPAPSEERPPINPSQALSDKTGTGNESA